MSKETLVCQFFVAGLIYADYADTKLKRGQRISLVKQPDNLHDSNAIRVYKAGRQPVWLGFVPRDQTGEIHGFKGKITRAVVHAYEVANATHRRCLVNIYGVAAKPEEMNVIC